MFENKRQQTVLIVHDCMIEAASLSLTLLSRGYRTVIAGNAKQVFEMAQQHQIDCVLFGDQELDAAAQRRAHPGMENYMVLDHAYPKDTVWGRLTVDDHLPIRLEAKSNRI